MPGDVTGRCGTSSQSANPARSGPGGTVQGGTMRVFVAGAAGAVGQQLLPQLVAQGHQVTAATRTPAKAGRLRELGAEPAVVDGLDAMAVGEAVARAEPDAVIHQMTSLAGGVDKPPLHPMFPLPHPPPTPGNHPLLAAAPPAPAPRGLSPSHTPPAHTPGGGPP